MNRVYYVAEKEFQRLRPLCEFISYAGSIRRKVPDAKDVDFVVIPKNVTQLQSYVLTHQAGNIGVGKAQMSYKYLGVEVDLFIASRDDWGAQLHWRTGPKGHNIGFCCIAKKAGWTLNEHGLWSGGTLLAGKTEEDIYKYLGKTWKAPELRGL